MHKLSTLACLSALTAVAACAPSDGYYDANGQWHNDTNYNRQHYSEDTSANATRNNYDYDYAPSSTTTTTTYTYSRPGYYDSNGYYISYQDGPQVPRDFMPPRGMCRVWFSDRSINAQPPVESCNGIQYRAPRNAYVVYGG